MNSALVWWNVLFPAIRSALVPTCYILVYRCLLVLPKPERPKVSLHGDCGLAGFSVSHAASASRTWSLLSVLHAGDVCSGGSELFPACLWRCSPFGVNAAISAFSRSSFACKRFPSCSLWPLGPDPGSSQGALGPPLGPRPRDATRAACGWAWKRRLLDCVRFPVGVAPSRLDTSPAHHCGSETSLRNSGLFDERMGDINWGPAMCHIYNLGSPTHASFVR